MRSALPVFLGLLLSVWLGAIVQLLLSVSIIFRALPRELAGQTAAQVFATSERVLLGVGGLAVTACIGWRLIAGSRLRKALLWTSVAALAVAASSTLFVSSRIHTLREAGQTQTTAFKRLHGLSNVAYLLQGTLVLGAGTLFTLSARQDAASGSLDATR